MTPYTWVGGTSDWNVGSNWSPGSPAGPPTAMDTATISATGAAYTVTIDTADVAQSLTESSASATVNDMGSLTLCGTFTLSAGTFILDSGGTLSGGTTKVAGGTFACDGGTLSGVTYDGRLDLSETDASRVSLANGTVVNNAAGTGAGTISDTGYDSCLYFDNTQTFNNATINLGNTSIQLFLRIYSTGAGTVLTLGSNVAIDESGKAYYRASASQGDGIVNQGNITQSGTGSYLDITAIPHQQRHDHGRFEQRHADDRSHHVRQFRGSRRVQRRTGLYGVRNFSNTGSITLASGGSSCSSPATPASPSPNWETDQFGRHGLH